MAHSFHPELQYQIALTMAQAIGPVTARRLINKIGSASAVFKMNKASLEKIPGIGPLMSASLSSSTLMEKAAREMEFIERYQISVLFLEDPEYPQRLKECEDAPILIYARGNTGLNSSRALSVVGTRRASSYGKELCRNIVLEMGSKLKDLVIISGLAYGIDVIAHRAALESGIPTIAVLGHGLNTIYPQAHRETAKKICGQGCLVTDFHSGMGPERNNFLRRNRIIAGLADATLVVESAAEGGALITADLASSYNRDVLAVPGRTSDVRSRGCNRLIKKNVAAMVESAEDITDLLNWSDNGNNISDRSDDKKILTHQERQLLDLLSVHNGLRPGDLSAYSGIPIQQVLSLLIQMELKGWIAVEPGNLYQSIVGDS
jgi:DNA processing protein